jgi:hypothetical protein
LAPPPQPTRKSSFVLPPPTPPAHPVSPSAHALFPTPLPHAIDLTNHEPTYELPHGHEFTMPPGYVPEQSKGVQFGPLTVASVGIAAMIISYITFLSFNPFR